MSPKSIMNRSLGQSHGLKVEVTDISTGVKSSYHAIKAAARALSIDRRYIENYIYLKQFLIDILFYCWVRRWALVLTQKLNQVKII